jgi:SAM-dependent methyltransferase
MTTTPAHLGGAHIENPDFYTWLPDIWERLIVDYDIRSVLDLGCGAGWSTAWFQKRVGRVIGVEGDLSALAVRKCDPIVTHDYTVGPFVPVDVYDLGWCAEFVEHVEAKFMANWMVTLQKCRYVCMTFATPGQGGHHHVNEQEELYWLDKFKAAGFECMTEETARMRSTWNGETWGRKTLTLFRNRIVGHPDASWLLAGMKATVP